MSSLGSAAVVAAAAGLLVLAPPGQARAADRLPAVSGSFLLELYYDDLYDAEPGTPTFGNAYAEAELGIDVDVAPWLGLHSLFKMEQARGVSDDSAFRHQGAYVEELFAEFRFDELEIVAGKFTPNFGVAWQLAPGVYGANLAEDYEFAEQIGAGVAYTVDTAVLGEHVLSAATFFSDRSELSRRVFTSTQPARVRLADGGPGNTKGFESWQVGLDGSDVAGVEGLFYHLSAISFGKGENTAARMRGLAAAAGYDVALGRMAEEEVVLTPLVEWAEFRNFLGDDGRRATYLTTGLQLAWDGFNVALSRTGRNDRDVGVDGNRDYYVQVSAGYAWELGPLDMGFDVGHLWAREATEDSRTWGAILSTAVSF